MKLARVLLVALTLAHLIACTALSPQKHAAAHFDLLPDNYQIIIEEFIAKKLRDPGNATYRYGTPQKGYWKVDILPFSPEHFGYIVPVGINERNGSGGYKGEQSFYFGFEDETLYNLTSLWGRLAGFLN